MKAAERRRKEAKAKRPWRLWWGEWTRQWIVDREDGSSLGLFDSRAAAIYAIAKTQEA